MMRMMTLPMPVSVNTQCVTSPGMEDKTAWRPRCMHDTRMPDTLPPYPTHTLKLHDISNLKT
eukprot:1095761-Karenia_brevis.AAC.1